MLVVYDAEDENAAHAGLSAFRRLPGVSEIVLSKDGLRVPLHHYRHPG